MRISIFLLIVFFPLSFVFAQSGQIEGKIVDDFTGLPLQDVHVFIHNTTYQTFSDSTGKFLLNNIQDGQWEIQVRGNGYNTQSQTISALSGKTLEVVFSLEPDLQSNPLFSDFSKGKLKKYKSAVEKKFLADHPSSWQVELLNSDQLIFEKRADKKIQVTSQGPLYFSNRETGYLVTIYFSPFLLGDEQPELQAYSYFELPEGERIEERRSNRLRIHQQSPTYFLSQLMIGEIGDFRSCPNPEVSFSDQEGEYFLRFDTPLEIETADGRRGRMYYEGEKLQVKLNGAPTDWSKLQWRGELFEDNPIYAVPQNFNADRVFALANLEKNAQTMQERIYLHTDRRHYWPGEQILFKAYLSYTNPVLAQDLSKVLHIELIDTTGYVWSHQVFRITDGISAGQLALPDLSETGNFFLRAYTTWSLNYEQAEHILPIQILDHFSKPEASSDEFKVKNVRVFTDKQKYEGQEKVTLNVMITSDDGEPINSNFSIAVLDLKQAVYVPERGEIAEQLSEKSLRGEMEDFKYPLEKKGFELEGLLQDNEGNPIQGSIQAFVNGYEDERKIKSEKDGSFAFSSLDFEEDFEINLKATSVKNQPIRTIKLDLKSYPSEGLDLEMVFPKKVERGKLSDKNIQPVKPIEAGEILLETAEVKGKKDKPFGTMIYGIPDNVVESEELNLVGSTVQFIYALMAKVPGMTVMGSPPNMSVRFRGGEPLILINGTPANGLSGGTISGGASRSFYNVLEGINVFAIDRVEVIRRLVPQYGDQGRNGLISIFLKTGAELAATQNNFNLFKLEGFQRYMNFSKAQETREKFPFLEIFKPTLFWSPSLISTKNTLSIPVEFQLNELAGPLLVEIRGLTDLGEPIYGTFVLNDK
jgi:hypothetical protein